MNARQEQVNLSELMQSTLSFGDNRIGSFPTGEAVDDSNSR